MFVAPAGASELSLEDIGPKLIDGFVTDITTLQSRFEQSLMDADGRILEVSTGTLEIQRPGRFRWAYSEPYEQLLVADGLNVWSYDIDLAQVTVKPQAAVLSNTPAQLLGGSRDAMDQFVHDGVRGRWTCLGTTQARRQRQRVQARRTRIQRHGAESNGVLR